MLLNLKKHKHALFLLFSIIFFSSCATRNKNALFQSSTDNITDTLKTVFIVNDQGPQDLYYKIKPTDLLSIRNLQNPEFGASGSSAQNAPASFYVELDGNVVLPVIGKVQIAGLTRREATVKLQELYSKSLLKDPIIELMIVNLKVTLLGEFTGKGNYVLEKDNTTLIEILGLSGGLTELADPKRIKIIRGDRKNPEIIYVNLKDINSISHPKLVLQNNDLIYAEPRRSLTQEKLQLAMTYVQPIIFIINTLILINVIR